jgi:hypothetical protein
MSALFARRKRLIVVLAGLTGCIVIFEAWARWITVMPLREPIALSRTGLINKEFEIRRKCMHSIELILAARSITRDEAASLVGDLWIGKARNPKDDTGVKIPVKWSISNPEGNIIASGEHKTDGWSAVSATEFRRLVEPYLRLPPGLYHLSATVLRDIPEMDGMTAHLRIGCANEKSSSGWQDDSLFFGRLIELLIALPLMSLLFINMTITELRRSTPSKVKFNN